MQTAGIDACVIPSTDPHLGEEVADHWKIITWLTGFTGSSATVVITGSFAGLWTDSRYFLQAEKELGGSAFRLIRPDTGAWNDYLEFLYESLEAGNKVGLDGRTLSMSQFRNLAGRLKKKSIIIDTGCDLVTEIWTGRPALPASRALDHKIEFSGKTRERKLTEVREQMKVKGVKWQLMTSREDIMWLLNIRGNDLKFSPLLDSFALAGEEQVILFADETRFPPALASEFDSLGVVILPYGEAWDIIPTITENSAVLADPFTTPAMLFNSVAARSEITEDISIPSRLKAIKNKTEISNLARVMINDGTALVKFLFWLDSTPGRESLSEKGLAEKILEFRSGQKDFLGPSFQTIVAFNQNSALPHYAPSGTSDSPIAGDGILLIDSGGQYPGGTTDITRTVAVGVPAARQIRDFTLVLKGHIRLARIKFPLGTRGHQLDILAREALWADGLNFGHGTGHGIGFFLNVHEGPQSISPADNRNIISPGMVLSNEPAIYREGQYGIRTENVLICYEDEETEFGRFLKFDTISLCHIDKTLIDKSLLNWEEISWINSYHTDVYDKISPFLTDDEKKWLREKTEPL